jgi:hypothetical protein
VKDVNDMIRRDRVIDFAVKFFPRYAAEDDRLIEGVCCLV